jgi:replication-associated recombination protein RarA
MKRAARGRDHEPVRFQPARRTGTRTGKRPLAERMRPTRLEDYIGQEHILGPDKPLRRQIERDQLTSIILWGPPGVGKTTLAKLIARLTRCEFIPFSAVLSGIKEIKAVMADAERLRRMGRRTILFIDEIHRFNKAQQDAFLPYVERGDIILIGATTENPSFEVISALLSRSRVYALRGLTVPEIVTLLKRALPRSRWKRPTICWSRSPSIPTATRARRTTRWKRPRRHRAAPRSPRPPCRTPCSARCCSTTRAAKSIST